MLALSADEHYGFILISDVKWWEKSAKEQKATTVFMLAAKSCGALYAEKLLFYVKRPFMQIRGVADFLKRVAGDAKELWEKYGDKTCLESFEEYVKFLGGKEKATFIRFTNFQELETPVSMDLLKKVLRVSKIPRGGKYISCEAVNQLIT